MHIREQKQVEYVYYSTGP